MNKPIHPAVAEHVMEENARLREVLRCIADLPMDRCSTENDYRLSAAKAIALGALSQQAETIEPVPAQDEREAFKRALYSQKVFKLSSATIDAAEWAWFARPAQTEQQPVAMVDANDDGMWADILPNITVKVGQMLYAAPIAQTAPQPA